MQVAVEPEWGLARPALRRSGSFLAQAAGMVAFGALAVSAVAAGPELALYLTAAGWMAHGIWDFTHLWKEKVGTSSPWTAADRWGGECRDP